MTKPTNSSAGFNINKLALITLLILTSSHANALSLAGQTAFSKLVEINSAVPARIEKILVRPGQTVTKGQRLILLDKTLTQASVDHAIAVLNSLKPSMKQASDELERAQELFDRETLSLIEMQLAENQFKQAEAHVKAAQAKLKMAKYALDQSKILSPIDGIVLQISTNESRYINPMVESESLMTLVATNQMLANAMLSSEQWDPTLIREKVEVKYKDKSYPGKIIFIGYQRQTQTSGIPGFELKVIFPTKSDMPANMPVTILIGQEEIDQYHKNQVEAAQKKAGKEKE